MDRWLDHLTVIGRAPSTIREHRRIIERNVKPAFGQLRASKLTAAHLDHLYAEMVARGLKPGSVRRTHAVIAAGLHQALKWDIVTRNVAEQATPGEVPEPEGVAPTVEEVNLWLAAAEALDPYLAAAMLFAALTGLRRGELCGLRWPDVTWQPPTVTVARSVYEPKGGGWAIKDVKNHQTRRVALDGPGVAVLAFHRRQVEQLAASLELDVLPDGFIFSRSPVGLEPVRPDYLTKFVVRAGERAGLDVHLHQLRHFCATDAIAAGFDPVTVAGRLGHRDASVTLRIYAHALEQRDRALAMGAGKGLAIGRSRAGVSEQSQ